MSQGDTPITLIGNVVADPELRFTPSGAAVVNFRVASTPRRYNSQSQQWEDGEALFLTCNVWRQAAENIAESLQKGMRVIVNGRLRQRSYETREGEQRTVYEVEADEVGPSLKFATARVTRANRGSQGGGAQQGGFGGAQQGGFGGGQQGGFGGTQQGGQIDDPWGQAPAAAGTGGGFGGQEGEPPF